jgi:ribose transport system substrate-binding protein
MFLVVGVAAAVLIAACGSDSKSSSSTSAAAATTGATSATTQASTVSSSSNATIAPLDTSSVSTGSGSGSAEIDAANAFIAPYLEAPKTIPLTESLKAAPTAGKMIVFLQCELSQCKSIGDGVHAAADVVGWKFQSIPYESTNPSTLSAAMDQSLQYSPVAVAFTSPPYALWSQKVEQFAKAGIALIPSFTGAVPFDDTIIANPASADYANLNGQLLGNWFISDSKATGRALSVNIPDFPYLDSVSKGFNATVASGCAACTVTKLDVGIPDLGSGAITGIIVSAVRKDPSINYVVVSDGEFALALPAALDAAGLGDKVKVAGCCGGAASETGLADGSFSALTGVNGNYAGYITVDAALRFAEGSAIPANEGDLPVGLLVEGTTQKADNSYNEPSDYVDQLKTLWQVG